MAALHSSELLDNSLVCQCKSEQMFIVLVIAFVLNHFVVKEVGYQFETAACFQKHRKDGNLNEEVANEMYESNDDNCLVKELVSQQVENLNDEQEAVKGADNVRAFRFEVERGTLSDCISQHHYGVEVEHESCEGENRINHVVARNQVDNIIAIFHKESDREVNEEVDRQAGQQNMEQLVRLLPHIFSYEISRLANALNHVG